MVDECHRSGFGDWFGVLEHFEVGLSARTHRYAPRDRPDRSPDSRRRGGSGATPIEYFGEPRYVPIPSNRPSRTATSFHISSKSASRIWTRTATQDQTGSTLHDAVTSSAISACPSALAIITEDLWSTLGKYGLRDEKTIIFCVDDTHAAFIAAELRRLAGDPDYAARITRSERNSHQLERNFADVGRAKPRVAATVDLLTTGFDAPDVKNIVFAKPVKSAILYKQMKGRGTRLCDDIDKRYFTIFDYAGANLLEDAEFDGHPANLQKSRKPATRKKSARIPEEKPVGEGVSVYISSTERHVCLADGRKIPFDEYEKQSREVIRSIAPANIDQLLEIWIDKNTRSDLRSELTDRDIHVAAFRHYLELDESDDVDILVKVGFELVRVPSRRDRVARFWDADENWLLSKLGEHDLADAERFKTAFWQTGLDHYSLYGIDDLETGSTYSAPQFVEQFGSFSRLLSRYGGANALREDLEAVKHHLYVPMAA